jgi:4-amino-4-deoxy-L-arabinose transferase-like glycosyltransferase
MSDIPPVKEAFFFYNPTFLYERGEQWAAFYPIGHPLALALGELFGAAKLVPPIVGGASVVCVYFIGKRLFDWRTGLLAAALMASSPFFLMQASNFMSHNTAALYVLLSLVFVLKRERPLAYGLIAGVFFGLAFNTRPLSAIALVPSYGLVLLSYLWARETRREGMRHLAAFMVGGGLMALAYLAYNYGLTGNAFESSYAGNEGAIFGFKQGHTLDVGIRNQQAQLMAFGLVFNNWPGFASLALLLAPFVLGTRNRWDYFLAAGALLPILAYTFYRFSGLYEGPRYWYEVAPFLFLLAARGADAIAGVAVDLANRVRWRLKRPTRAPAWAGVVPVYAVVALLVIYGSGRWLTGREDGWSDYEAHLVPNSPDAMHSVFDVDNRLDVLARQTRLENAIVLVKPCGFFGSVHCYGTVFLRNGTDFDGDVVWANYDPNRNPQLIAAFPGRKVYVATYDGKATIEPYTP